MKKGISKEYIIDVALDLMKDKEDLRSLNLREIARTIGCAHTNLYNYFSSFDDLLWEAHIILLQRTYQLINGKMSESNEVELKLHYFFYAYIEFYLNHRGWFRLGWVEIIGGERPQNNEIATVETVDAFVDSLIDIWEGFYGVRIEKERMKYALHNVHCYIHGEISIYIARRSLITEESEFKHYVTKEAVKMMRLLLKGD